MLNPQFLHIRVTGLPHRIDVRAAERGTEFFEQIHGEVDALVLIVREGSVPGREFVADFDSPCHSNYYTLQDIYRQRHNCRARGK